MWDGFIFRLESVCDWKKIWERARAGPHELSLVHTSWITDGFRFCLSRPKDGLMILLCPSSGRCSNLHPRHRRRRAEEHYFSVYLFLFFVLALFDLDVCLNNPMAAAAHARWGRVTSTRYWVMEAIGRVVRVYLSTWPSIRTLQACIPPKELRSISSRARPRARWFWNFESTRLRGGQDRVRSVCLCVCVRACERVPEPALSCMRGGYTVCFLGAHGRARRRRRARGGCGLVF